MKAAKKGGPLANAGVRGRLGDLATIAPEYDVAVRYKLMHFLFSIQFNSIEFIVTVYMFLT